jgi:hypothetical protein
VGDKVRISVLKTPFLRHYSETFTNEIFIVAERYKKQFIPTYRLKDWNNEGIEGSFYTSELQKVNVDEQTSYNIEKILKTRTRRGKKEHLVRWQHWGPKYDSWIQAREIEKV